jgi:hypothetical protein
VTKAIARVAERPSPADWSEDAPLRLDEAVAVFGGLLPITVPMLRTEIRKGRLTPAEVAGKFFVTPAQLKALFQCPAAPKARASTSAPEGGTTEPAKPSPTSMSSVTERLRSARAAALSSSRRQSEPLANISPPSSRRPPLRPTVAATPLRS